MSDIEAIKARHEAANELNAEMTVMNWRIKHGAAAHSDIATLLSALTAAEARLSGPFTVEKFNIEDDWTTEIHADGVRIASGYPSGNPQTTEGSGAKIRELVDRANRCAAAEARAEAAEARVGELEKALEWALDNADTDHPHYPVREGDIWVYMYLVHGSPMGGGVGTARFETALDAVSAAQTETRKP